MKKSLLKKERIFQTLKQIGLTAQVHGIPRIFQAKKIFLKLMWTVFFICSVIAYTYFFTITLCSYFQYSVVSKIDLVSENPMTFPTITFCSNNPPTRNYSLNDFIIECKFNNIIDCSTDQYFQVYFEFYQFRTCYRFNSGQKLLYSTRTGQWNGLSLKLFEGLYFESRSHPLNQSFSDGLMVFIHNKSSKITTSNINIQPGVYSYLGLRKTIDTKLTLPYNDCIDDLDSYKSFESSLYKNISNEGFIYNQLMCLDYAFLRFVAKCPLSFDECANNLNKSTIVTDFSAYYENQTFREYLPLCPEECTTTQFQITLSQNSYPSNIEFKNLKSNSNLMSKFGNASLVNLDDLKKSVYMVSIYFEDLKYTLISQQAKTNVMDLVSSIGGSLGLFMGASFLSLIDIVQIIFEIIYIKFDKNRVSNF